MMAIPFWWRTAAVGRDLALLRYRYMGHDETNPTQSSE